MIRVACPTALIALLVLFSPDLRMPTVVAAAAQSSHAYFDALVARQEHWQSWSLRDSRQLDTRENGGAAGCNSCPLDVTYGPAFDGDPRRQDAAKVVIPAGKASIRNIPRFPMRTVDGNSYFVTWDAWFGAEYAMPGGGMPQQKTFQFASEGIWFEIQTRYNLGAANGGLAQVTTRGYAGGGDRLPGELAFGPNVTHTNPLPQAGIFTIKAETWTRYWVLIDQRAGNFDLASVWVADEHTNPVQIVDKVELNVLKGSIDDFWLEYNTSTAPPADRGPLVGYVRNLVMLRNVFSPTSLMQRPNAGVPLPPLPNLPRPSAPRGLRIIPTL